MGILMDPNKYYMGFDQNQNYCIGTIVEYYDTTKRRTVSGKVMELNVDERYPDEPIVFILWEDEEKLISYTISERVWSIMFIRIVQDVI